MSNGINESVKNIDKILSDMNADHPGDIFADIFHWCDAKGEDFDDLLRRGRDYYRDEVISSKILDTESV